MIPMAEARIVSGLWSESETENVVRPGWHKQANCRGKVSTFFGARFDSPRPSKKVRLAIMEAKNICAACPVRNLCLEFALDHDEDFGVWGGLTPRERRMIRVRAS